MSTIAVTGASGPVGRALLERLDADPAVTRIVGVDVVEPPMPVAKLDMRTTDVRDRLLPLALDGVDVLVHLALDDLPQHDEDTLFARNLQGTRNVLDAAAKVGVRGLVHLSGWAAYGAHENNPLPLTEKAPLRANPDFAPGYHQLLAEELVGEFADAHPETRVAVLRPAALVGPGVDHVLARHFEAPRFLMVGGCAPPLQFLHVDDLAEALHRAAAGELTGTYNVAADGWLSTREVCAVLGLRPLRVPETFADTATRWLWAKNLSSVPPGALHLLSHPTVLSAAKLRATGWAPARSNRESLREFAAEHHGWVRIGPLRIRRRDGWLSVAAVVGLTVGAAGALVGRRGRLR
ncbi:MAG: NAD-dependent epimerase/dehydratase family protein [Euzebyales bacterium]|nr:NAD-dependent epimerase/dehydratase family protein [Euzebyales bacterium]